MKRGAASPSTRFADPIWITVALWLWVVIGALAVDLNPLSPLFLCLLAVAVASHVAGMAVRRLTRLHSSFRQPVSQLTRRTHDKATRTTTLLLAVLIGAFVFFARAYAEVVPSLDSLGFLAARNAYLEEVRGLREKLFLYTTHVTLLGIAVLFYATRAYGHAHRAGLRPSKTPVNAVAIATFAVALLTTGRTAPLLVILSYSFFCLRFGIYNKKTIVVAFGICALTMFFLVALALGKEGLGDSDQISAADALLNLGRIYFFSAPVAVQEVVMNGVVVSNACTNTFSYLVDLAKKVGLFQHCDVRELDFVFVPVATNVYTFFRAYWEDFGWGYPIALFMVGYLIESVHIAAFTRERYGAFIYPFFFNALLLQVFEEQLFANGSVFAYLTLGYIVCGFFYRPPATRRRAASPSLAVGPQPLCGPAAAPA